MTDPRTEIVAKWLWQQYSRSVLPWDDELVYDNERTACLERAASLLALLEPGGLRADLRTPPDPFWQCANELEESPLSVPQPPSPNALPSLERKDLDAWILRAERAEQSERELLREVESLRARIDVTLGEVTMSGEQADGVSFRAAIDAAMSARQNEAPEGASK